MNSGLFLAKSLNLMVFSNPASTTAMELTCFRAYSTMTDNANLLDMNGTRRVGRFVHHIVDESAARD